MCTVYAYGDEEDGRVRAESGLNLALCAVLAKRFSTPGDETAYARPPGTGPCQDGCQALQLWPLWLQTQRYFIGFRAVSPSELGC